MKVNPADKIAQNPPNICVFLVNLVKYDFADFKSNLERF